MFTPLTIVMLIALLAGFAATRSIVDVDRNLLILMDLILVLVLGLLLYAISARDPRVPPDLSTGCSCCWCSARSPSMSSC